jgi:glucokinase
MANTCVIDIGGSNFRCGVYRQGYLDRTTIGKSDTPNYKTHSLDSIRSELVERITSAYTEKVQKFGALPVLAIGFPGPVAANGTVQQSSVVFGVDLKEPFDLRGELSRSFKTLPHRPKSVLVTNDMTASAWRYADSGLDPFCLITVSSGIGNKIFAHGEVLIGDDGLAGEIGHYAVEIPGLSIPCSCGSGNNHVGMVSSGRGIELFARRFARRGGEYRAQFLASKIGKVLGFDSRALNNELLARAADQGDTFCRRVIDFCTVPLAHAIGLLALALYLRKFILIGGFALHCRYYRAALIDNVIRKGIYNFGEGQIREMIIYGKRDDYHTLIGLGRMVDKGKFESDRNGNAN